MEYKSEESVFNMALAYLKRIDKLLYMCQQASMEQNIPMWISSLRGVYRELSVKLSDEEEKDIFGEGGELINVCSKSIDYSLHANFRNINYLYNNPACLKQNKNMILYLLDKLEIKIRRKLQQKGMLLPSKDDPRFAVLKR